MWNIIWHFIKKIQYQNMKWCLLGHSTYTEIYSKEKKNILILPKYANHTLVVYDNAAYNGNLTYSNARFLSLGCDIYHNIFSENKY